MDFERTFVGSRDIFSYLPAMLYRLDFRHHLLVYMKDFAVSAGMVLYPVLNHDEKLRWNTLIVKECQAFLLPQAQS